jgi:hypothetical protein
MKRPTHQHGLRIARNVAGAIVRMWPEETREWGLAFEAEFSEIETGGVAFSWLIGGVMLLLREWWKNFWRMLVRPIGANSEESFGAFTKQHSRVPRTPLWAMLLLLLSSAALLLHPEVRQALRGLHSSYARTEWEPSRWSSVKKLQQISKTNRDPQLLALLSLLSIDDEERLRLSEEAIDKDASLTWLDYEQSLLPLNDLSRQNYLPKGRLDRLLKWDPQNAVPHVLAAEVISKPARTEAFDAVMHGRSEPGWEKSLTANPAWISEMNLAFSAPKYDNYVSESIELIRNVNSRYSVKDPEIARFVLSRKRMVQFDVLRGYTKFLMEREAALKKPEERQEVIAAYSQILQFSQRIALGGGIPTEVFFAQGIGMAACERLQPLYEAAGHKEEASLVAFQLEKWKAERDPKLLRYVPLHYRQTHRDSLAWSGLLINVAGLSLVVVGPAALLSFFFVYWRRKVASRNRGKIDCWASILADGTPWLLLASSVLIFLTYHPYARVCSAFLKGGIFSPDIESFLAAALVPHASPDRIDLLRDAYSQWLGATALLFLVAVFLLWRITIRRAPAA